MTLLFTVTVVAFLLLLQITFTQAPLAAVMIVGVAGALTPFVTQLTKKAFDISGRYALILTVGVSVVVAVACAFITGEAKNFKGLIGLAPWIFAEATILYRLWYPSAASTGNIVIQEAVAKVQGTAVVLLAVLVLGTSALAQTTSAPVKSADRVDVYVGYQFDRASFSFEEQDFEFNDSTDTHGVNASLAIFPGDYGQPLGITGEFGANFSGGRENASLVTAMGGIILQARKSKVQPFVRGLIGGARIRVANQQLENFFDTSDVSLAWAVGGGLDVRLGKKVAWRIIQADYMRTKNFGVTINHLRLGTGIRF